MSQIFLVQVGGTSLVLNNQVIRLAVGSGFDSSAEIALNTAHRTGNGSDHANVALNDTHRSGNGADHANVALNDTHRTGNGSDHANVALNDAHRSGNGADHANVALNDTHRAKVTGNPHAVTKSEVGLPNVIDGAGNSTDGHGVIAGGVEDFSFADNDHNFTAGVDFTMAFSNDTAKKPRISGEANITALTTVTTPLDAVFMTTQNLSALAAGTYLFVVKRLVLDSTYNYAIYVAAAP